MVKCQGRTAIDNDLVTIGRPSPIDCTVSGDVYPSIVRCIRRYQLTGCGWIVNYCSAVCIACELKVILRIAAHEVENVDCRAVAHGERTGGRVITRTSLNWAAESHIEQIHIVRSRQG